MPLVRLPARPGAARSLLGASLLVLAGGAFPAAASGDDAAADSARAALEAELDALLVEVSDAVPRDDPFADGSLPDLVLCASADVYGELAPCG